MNAWVVYESMWGNTEEVARAIARGLAESCSVTVFDVGSAPTRPDPDVDLIVAGGPTHAFSMSRPRTRTEALRQGAPGHRADEKGLREWLAGLPEGEQGPRLVTFDTRVTTLRRLPGSAARSATRVGRRHGYETAAASRSFYVEDTAGPLLGNELQRAEWWGRRLGKVSERIRSAAGPRSDS